MAQVHIDQIRKSYGATEVLKGINLTVEDGEFIALVGPSGCGKSTLLRIVAGLEDPSGGHIAIAGENVENRRAADRNLSMVFQSYALYPHLTVAENIAVPLRMRQLTRAQRLPLVGRFTAGARSAEAAIADAVEQAAKTLDIAHLLDRKPGQLSGGQRQRVALGRALVREPRAFLLDEPLSNLDAKLRVQTRAEIAQLHRRLGATFIYVTHDQVEAMTMSDRIAVMMDGEILQCASPDVVYNDPADIRVAEFIGSPKINVVDAEVGADGRVSIHGHRLPLAVAPGHRLVHLALRPEKLHLTHAGAPLEGRVAHMENLGNEVFVQLDVAGQERRLIARADPAAAREFALGQPVGLQFRADDALVFAEGGQRLREVAAAPLPEIA